MEQFLALLDEILNFDLIQATVSGARKKGGVLKIKIRPVVLKDELVFQASAHEEKKVFHKNYTKEELTSILYKYGEEKFAPSIAKKIVEYPPKK